MEVADKKKVKHECTQGREEEKGGGREMIEVKREGGGREERERGPISENVLQTREEMQKCRLILFYFP